MTAHLQPRRLALLAALGLALTLWNVLPGSAARPQLTVTPAQGLVDGRVRIRVVGLPARALVTLAARTADGRGNSWSSSAKLRADAHGVVDTRGDMSLFWTMKPARHALALTSLVPADGPTPVRLTASIGGKAAARGTYTRRLAAAGITTADETLAGQGFVGTYYALPSVDRTPAVLQLGGSAGGHSETPAVLLAAHGYPTLSLAYFGEPGLPAGLHNIPLEYFEKALQWLGRQPGVDPSRIVVVGLSRGGEAALLTGVMFPDLVHGVVACESSFDVQGGFGPGSGPAWTYQGQPVPAQAIPVEKINGPVLAFGAGDDQIAPSADAARRIAARARAHGRTDINAVIYQNAGHGAGCNFPNVPRPGYATSGSATIQLGGTPAGNALAAASSWPLLLRFIAHVP